MAAETTHGVMSGANDKRYFCPNCGVGPGCHHHSWCDRTAGMAPCDRCGTPDLCRTLGCASEEIDQRNAERNAGMEGKS